MTFGNYILEKRKSLNHKRIFVADKLGVSAAYLRDIELGNRPAPHSEMLLRLLAILEIEKGTPEHVYALDLASETRDDIPLDIKKFLQRNQDIFYKFLRKINDGYSISNEIKEVNDNKIIRTKI